MKTKPITPYQRLLEEARKYASNVEYPLTIGMWVYPKDKLDSGWSITDLYERTAAAKTLGYDVILVATDKGLEVKYQKKRPERPWSLKY